MTQLPLPELKSGSKTRLDEFLRSTVKKRITPGIFLGATNAHEELYFNAFGDKEFGDSSKGMITQDTGECLTSSTHYSH